MRPRNPFISVGEAREAARRVWVTDDVGSIASFGSVADGERGENSSSEVDLVAPGENDSEVFDCDRLESRVERRRVIDELDIFEQR